MRLRRCPVKILCVTSLYETLAEKLRREGGGGRLGGARADISILLFNYREAIQELWLAADAGDRERTAKALEALRPLFGEAARQPTSP